MPPQSREGKKSGMGSACSTLLFSRLSVIQRYFPRPSVKPQSARARANASTHDRQKAGSHTVKASHAKSHNCCNKQPTPKPRGPQRSFSCFYRIVKRTPEKRTAYARCIASPLLLPHPLLSLLSLSLSLPPTSFHAPSHSHSALPYLGCPFGWFSIVH